MLFCTLLASETPESIKLPTNDNFHEVQAPKHCPPAISRLPNLAKQSVARPLSPRKRAAPAASCASHAEDQTYMSQRIEGVGGLRRARSANLVAKSRPWTREGECCRARLFGSCGFSSYHLLRGQRRRDCAGRQHRMSRSSRRSDRFHVRRDTYTQPSTCRIE